ncbi:unnamed protein product [Heligmosomoides polygyrus]|uniref:AA_permease_C domain-containing protein n=1 Tax=Heligmosomoides polygyrus TaxID=6339 RepID=A0A183GHG6_HELPZ|nr:unnamed protein product [Heligmosomoides polygyrus]
MAMLTHQCSSDVQVLRAVCALSCAFAGVDATSYLFDETKSPRRKMPVLLPTLTTFLSLFFFIVVMIFSLSTDVSKLSTKTLVPEMFSVLNVPAAKYMLTVSAVCGLSGAVLSSFLPGSRIINALNADRLLPLPADMTRRPVMSVFIFFILVSFGLLIHRNILLNLVLFTTPLKMVATVCLVFLQHYRTEPVGILHETSHYKYDQHFSNFVELISEQRSIRKKRQQVSIAGDDGSIVTSTLTHDDDESDESSVDTSVFVQMAVAKRETQRLQRRLEKKEEKLLSEKLPVLAKSVSHYNSIGPGNDHDCSGMHNCIADSCPAGGSDGKTICVTFMTRPPYYEKDVHHVHLYARDVPEVPFVQTYNPNRRPSTPLDLSEEYRKAKWLLVLFIISSALFCQITLMTGFDSVSSSVLLSLFFVIVIIAVFLGCRLTPNDYLQRRQITVPFFPYFSYFTLFALILALASTKFFTVALYAVWLLIGLALYFMYGYWNSNERTGAGDGVFADDDNEMYRAIIGNDYTIQIE